ncbi:Protein ABHD13 [Hondaea fermentalgiana]|uniref:Protein ABHD13 n=1 Tax=Hondaea fermentalgiana TaxID=2315210 RepID=A0A2R5GJG0_9STRA|nr:Protein ABHD13 [Hondaea fermentalgiana]|eukprot:GBG31020.1 Protein ABHD13 [Hondaea fermentalgiana]
MWKLREMLRGRTARELFMLLGKGVAGATTATVGLCAGVGAYGAYSINQPRQRWFTDNFVLTPETMRLPYKKVTIETEDGILLDAWFMEQTVRGKASSNLVLCCNPYNQDKSSLLGVARGLWDSGYSVLLYDFRSHAREQTHQTIGYLEKRDGDAALDWLCANKPKDGRIGLVGASMGGAVALMLAAERRPEVIACATDCAFSCLKDVIGTRLDRMFPTTRLFGMDSILPLHVLFLESICFMTRIIYGYDPAMVGPRHELGNIDIPLLIVHSEKDSVVPLSHGFEVHSLSGSSEKEFFVVKNAEHIESFFLDEKEYTRRIVGFFDDVFGNAPAGLFVAGHEAQHQANIKIASAKRKISQQKQRQQASEAA